MRSRQMIMLVGFLFFLIIGGSLLLIRLDSHNSSTSPVPNQSQDEIKENHRLLTVKFRDESRVRLRDSGLISLSGENLTVIHTLLSSPDILEVSRLFSRRSEADLDQERKTQLASSSKQLADLNSYYLVSLKPETPFTDAKYLADQLRQQVSIESVYPEPIYQMALADVPPNKEVSTLEKILAFLRRQWAAWER